MKPRAFLPSPEDRKTSVFYINGLEEVAIWEIGETYVARPRRRTLYGRGEILAVEIEKVGLTVEPDTIPPRHVNIAGWPEEKDKQMSLAQELAAASVLRLRP